MLIAFLQILLITGLRTETFYETVIYYLWFHKKIFNQFNFYTTGFT